MNTNTTRIISYKDYLKNCIAKEKRNESIDRIQNLICAYNGKFKPENFNNLKFITSPGRCEIIGNFQDNIPELGHTLSCAIDSDAFGIMEKNNSKKIRALDINGMDYFETDFDSLSNSNFYGKQKWESMIMGPFKILLDKNKNIGGMNIVFNSTVPQGSGCSSSAALENLVTFGINQVYNLNLSPVDVALISKKTENEFFGKGCGLLDQLTSAVGNIVYIKSYDTNNIQYEIIPKWFDGYSLVIAMVDAGHKGGAEQYGQIKKDLDAAIKIVTLDYLRDPKLFDEKYQGEKNSDIYRRGLFFAQEYKNVKTALESLRTNDIGKFKEMINRSGDGSRNLLKNTTSEIDRAVEIARDTDAASRVHGGGFGGTMLSITNNPNNVIKALNLVFPDSAKEYHVRPGVLEINYQVL